MVQLAKAGKAHFIAGGILILLSLSFGILSFFYYVKWFGIATYFFGVWGGVEVGRYLESFLKKKEHEKNQENN